MERENQGNYALYEAIKEYQNGRKEKANVIYQESKEYSFRIIYCQIVKYISQNVICGDAKVIAEDIVQEVYMDFFQNILQFRNEELKSFYKWISVVANRKVLRYVNKNKMEVLQNRQQKECREECETGLFLEVMADVECSSEFVPDFVLEKKELQEVIIKCIANLSEPQAQTMIYRIYGGLKYQEIADIMGVSLITVKTRMRKAREHLKRYIRKYENGD